MKAIASGHVKMSVGEDIVTGSKIEIDLKTETGTIFDGTLFIKEKHYYIKGSKIKKISENSYTVEKASISTCDGKTPAWKITGRNLDVTIEGYGAVKHATLWAKKVPVLYSPYLYFPVKIKRQSGFLPPQAGLSERKGFEYIQPYFWAISESSDATFYFHHMQERGQKIGAEYRYILKNLSKGTAMYDYLYDRKIDDGTGDSSQKWGYPDDDVLRPNNDRYWFRMKHDQQLPYNFSSKLDLDIVSDQDYLNEFKTGYTGFEETNEYFYETFGRSLDDFNDPIRVNRLNFNRIWSSFSLNAEARWNDNVIYRRQDITTPPLQELPFIGFDASKQVLFKSPFYYDLQSSYIHFYRQEGARAHRGDIYPRIYLPYKYRNYFSVEPSAGVRGTVWYLSQFEDASTPGDRTFSRGIYDLRLDLNSEIYNVFSLNSKSYDRIKHSLRPRIVYDYIPHQDQDQLPFFGAIDRISEKNLVTYSLVNLFTSRSTRRAPAQKEKQNGVTPSTYHQFSRLKLEQSYDINKANDNEPEPFSPILGEFDFVLKKYFSLRTDAQWSPYSTDFLSHNIAARFSSNRKDRLFVEHRYTQGESESIYTDLLLNITNELSAYASYERNILEEKKIESGVGILYKAQCWSLDVRYIDNESDRKIEFFISLYGLGEVGTSIAGRTIETPFN
jgi:LPS-assembly protein